VYISFEKMSFGESWKALGNKSFQEGDFDKAIQHFSQAISVDAQQPVYYANRSLAYASKGDWESSLADAESALSVDGKFLKGHFRKVKALVELRRLIEARRALLLAIKECGENKDLRVLEDDICVRTGIPVRPKSSDFEIISELGDGNFSKVFKTYLKANKRLFAVKTIEKQTIDRMKRRHPNINNEILMEKRVGVFSRSLSLSLSRIKSITVFLLNRRYKSSSTPELLLFMRLSRTLGRFTTRWNTWAVQTCGCRCTNCFRQRPLLTLRRSKILTTFPLLVCNLPLTSPHSLSLTLSPDANGEDQNVVKPRRAAGAQLGAHWSLLRLHFAEIISAVEHMHR
jgi:uncharacterized protein YbcI